MTQKNTLPNFLGLELFLEIYTIYNSNIKKVGLISIAMAVCFKCGISSEKTRLFEAVGAEGVVIVCLDCSEKESIPLLKKPTTYQLKDSESKEYMPFRFRRYEALGREIPGGRNSRQVKTGFNKSLSELTLRDILDKNLKGKYDSPEGVKRDISPRIPLIDNFHWEVMRARRKKHLTYKQVADALAESETVIKMVEHGRLPEDDYRIIGKLEKFFDIRLVKSSESTEKSLLPREKFLPSSEKTKSARILTFDPESSKTLTISDLKAIKSQKEKFEKGYEKALEKEMNLSQPGMPRKVSSKEEFDRIVEEEILKETRENMKKKEGLDDKDINRLIWGKK